MRKPCHRRAFVRSRTRPGRARLRRAAALSLGLALAGLLAPVFTACRIRHIGSEPGANASGSASASIANAASGEAPAASASVPAEPMAAVSSSAAAEGGLPTEPAVIALRGVDSEPEDVETVRSAVAASRAAMTRGSRGALDAAVDGMTVIESSPSLLEAAKGDGGEHALLTDASVSGPGCWFAGVAALEGVRTPIGAARALCGASHPILAGDGALMWAQSLGLTDEGPAAAGSSSAASVSSQVVSDAGPPDASPPEWTPWVWLVGGGRRDGGLVDARAEADASEPRVPIGAAAVLVRDSTGAFAGAMSDADSDVEAPGRVGDVVIPGAALFVGEAGAVAISGFQGHLARLGLARAVYRQLAQHQSANDAAEWALAQVPDDARVGVVILDATGFAARSTTEMAWAAWVGGKEDSSASKPSRSAPPATSKGGER